MNKKIKILFTIPNFDTAGSGKVVYDLVNGLDKDVFAPEICCFNNKGEFFNMVEGLGVKIHLFEFATSYRPFHSYPFRIWSIYRFLKKNQFDMIHSWHWSSDISEPLAAKLADIPFVYTKKAMGWGNKSWNWRSKLSTKIIAINNDMMSQFFGQQLHKTIQIPLGVNTNYFSPLPKSYKTPEGIEIDKKDFVVVTVANLVPVKGIEILLDAIHKLNDPTIKIFIVGNDKNDYAEGLKKLYSQNINIHFIGKKMDVRPYLAVADVFVIPTKNEGRKEGMPIAPLEAMACQRIVLGSRISGVSDILSNFQNCLFNPDDPVDLAEKLNDIKNMPIDARKTIAKSMRNKVEESFNNKQILLLHEKLYKNILKA